jgi:5-methyltetrahydrofolate--homocysteine methyltransferase
VAYPEDWPRIRQRYEAWWQGEMLDRPLVKVTAPLEHLETETVPTESTALFAWFTDPEQVLPRLERHVAAIYHAGDAFPLVFPLSTGLPAIEAAYLGGSYHIAADTLTGWADPLIEDWATRPKLVFDPENIWWQATQRLLEAGARRGAGKYCVGLPDIQGGGEIVALLRGTERLLVDLVDCPEMIPPAIDEVNRAWLEYYEASYAIIHRYQEGYVDWLGIWSETPAVTVECDFAAMISPRMFNRYFLPFVDQQTQWIGRTIFHLDGPQALPHLDALLALPRLGGIQWVPTPDRPHPTQWIPLFQQIQVAGKRVVVGCVPSEVMPLLEALRPEAVLLSTSCASPAEADALVNEVERRFDAR